MQVGTIVAVQPDHKNGIPWFGKVTTIKNEHVEVIWLHKSKSNSKYFYLSKTTEKKKNGAQPQHPRTQKCLSSIKHILFLYQTSSL
jgi:hypothetical protein